MSSMRTMRHLRAVGYRTSRRYLSTTSPRLAGEVRIVEVGPRDGLQNEKKSIELKTKLELINRLAQTGLRNIEAGSFVAPKWVPQMANSADVFNHLLGHPPASLHPITYNYLVPNLKGLQNLLRASDSVQPAKPRSEHSYNPHDPKTPPNPPSPQEQEEAEPAPITSTQDPNEMPSDTSSLKDPVKPESSSATDTQTEISIFTAATEAFSKANTNCSIAESLARCKDIVALAKSRDIPVRGYVSVALGCPYEGPDVAPSQVAEITASLLEMGVDEVSVADTTGMGTAPRTRDLLKTLSSAGIANQDLALHFHDTYGQALVNTVVGLEHGIRTFDSSVGGLGGCPFSKGATGNIATEDLVYCLHSLGATTGVNVDKVAEIGAWISTKLDRSNDSRAGKAVLARLQT
ncbi:MAG: hypothetical protein LQ345_001874 [Seirophora villosa]|nr:MAG: hypothetical protein LQ345_001874 [Seirophora villosa]